MLDNPPTIIDEDNHPEDGFIFLRSPDLPEFLAEADHYVLQGDTRTLCWTPPSALRGKTWGITEAIEKTATQNLCRLVDEITATTQFLREPNIHIDAGDTGLFAFLHAHTILNKALCNLTQTLEGRQGTTFYHIPKNAPERPAIYKALDINTREARSNGEILQRHPSVFREAFTLAQGRVGLILPSEFNHQATAHGFPAPYTTSETRRTLLASIRPTMKRESHFFQNITSLGGAESFSSLRL